MDVAVYQEPTSACRVCYLDIHADDFASIPIEFFERCDADILYAAAMNDSP